MTGTRGADDGRRWIRRHPWRATALVLLVGFLLLNVFAWQHAHAMLHFTVAGARTRGPQDLTLGEKLEALVFGITVPRPGNSRTPAALGLPFETVRFAAADGLGLQGWLIQPPQPKGTVLLFHGYAAASSVLLNEAAAVHEMGFAALLTDFRGSGGSDDSCTSLGYLEALDVAGAVEHASARGLPRPFVLYGQSMGGAAILRAVAALRVQPDGVILDSVFDRMLNAVRNRFDIMGLPSFPTAELLVFWGGQQVGFSAFDHDPAEYARACECPVLVLHGAGDRHATPEGAQDIHDALAGEKEFALFPEASHSSLRITDEPRWTLAVSQFLTRRQEAAAHAR